MSGKMELICLPGSPWSAKVMWILDACSISVQKRPFEPFVDEIWLRYKLGLWPWQRRYWTRLTVPIAIVQPEATNTGGSRSCVLTESMDIAEWALRNAPGKEPLSDATLLKLRYWNDLSDVILQFGRAAFVEAAKRDIRVAIEVLSPPWMKRLPHFLTKLVMTVALRVFAMKYRRENAQSKLEAVMDAVKRIRATLKEGGGKYLVNDRFSYADIVMSIALNFLVPSEGVMLFSIPKKYQTDAADPLQDFDDVKAYKAAIFQHLPQVLRIPYHTGGAIAESSVPVRSPKWGFGTSAREGQLSSQGPGPGSYDYANAFLGSSVRACRFQRIHFVFLGPRGKRIMRFRCLLVIVGCAAFRDTVDVQKSSAADKAAQNSSAVNLYEVDHGAALKDKTRSSSILEQLQSGRSRVYAMATSHSPHVLAALLFAVWMCAIMGLVSIPFFCLLRGHLKSRELREKLENLKLQHPEHLNRQPPSALSDGMQRLAQEDCIIIKEHVNMLQEATGHLLNYSIQTANCFDVFSVSNRQQGEQLLSCREHQDLQAMIGMNLAGGLQALGLEGAGAFSGRDKAPFRMMIGLPQAQQQTNTMQVQVPAGVGPGQQIYVTAPDGAQMLVAVPAGMGPGQVFPVLLPSKPPSSPSSPVQGLMGMAQGLVPGAAANTDAPFLYLDRPFAFDIMCEQFE
eukprot:s2870_g3.t3